MLVYILKSSVCLAILLLFYKVLLEQENMHVLKRFYLLASLVLALSIPLVTFTQHVEMAPVTTAIPAELESNSQKSLDIALSEPSIISPSSLLWAIYIVGLLVFAVRFVQNLYRITKTIRDNPKLERKNSILVLLREKVLPHTFFSHIFLNKSKFETRQIPREVLLHEEAHVRQKHSFDVLFVEMLQVLFWFNPLFLLIKDAIKLNHEFLADRAVTQKGIDTATYQETLLVYSSNQNRPSLANAINYSSFSTIKKRFTVMKKETTRASIVLRSILVLPLLTLLLLSFSETKTVIKETNPMVDQDKTPFTERPFQEGLTKKQLREYNTLAAKYNTMLAKADDIHIKGSEVERLEYLYRLMTEEQKAKAEPFPDFPEPPTPPTPPAPPNEVEIDEVIEAGKQIIQEIIENQEVYDELSMLDKKMIVKTQEMTALQQKMFKQNLEIQAQAHAMEEQARIMEILHEKMQKKAGLTEQNQVKIEEQARKLEAKHLEMEQKAKEMEQKAREMEQKAREMEMEVMEMASQHGKTPPPPPAPKSPLEHIKEMAQKDAIFYHNGKEIPAEKAMEVVRDNKKIKLETDHENGTRPEVRLFTKR